MRPAALDPAPSKEGIGTGCAGLAVAAMVESYHRTEPLSTSAREPALARPGRWPWGVWALALVLCSCGDWPDDGGVGVGVAIQGLGGADVGAVQVSVVRNGSSWDCVNLSKACAVNQVAAEDYVLLTLDDDKQHRAAFFYANGDQVVGAGQSFAIKGIPAGKDYLVIAEVLGPNRNDLRASGCDLRQEIVKGDNPALSVVARAITPPPGCDPRVERQ